MGLSQAREEVLETGRIHSVNASSAGGVPKSPVLAARVTEAGLEGDRQRNRRLHGGPDRALCLYSLERVEELARQGHPIAPGSAGENVTVAGLEWTHVVPGARLRLGGSAVIEVTSYTTPCANIAGCFADGDFSRLHQRRRPGTSRVYARVFVPGLLRAGDTVELLASERPR